MLSNYEKEILLGLISAYFQAKHKLEDLEKDIAPLRDKRDRIAASIGEKLNGKVVVYGGYVWHCDGISLLCVDRYEELK